MSIVVTRVDEAKVRPLHWWSAAALGGAERRIQSLLEAWCNEWRLQADQVHAFNGGDGVPDEPSIEWAPLVPCATLWIDASSTMCVPAPAGSSIRSAM